MLSQDNDYIAREKIRTDIRSNFFVEAGAGSGKTTVLVDRMVSMVEGGIDISRICAITFTKAAASEFYARFQRKLSESKDPLAKEALKNIDLCFMGTINSFCNMVLSEHPAKAGIPSNSSVIDEEKMETLYRRELSAVQRGDYGEDLREKYELFRSYFYNADELFTKGISRLMGTRNTHLIFPKAVEGRIDDVYASDIDQIRSILVFLYNNPHALAEGSQEARDAKEALAEGIKTLTGKWGDELEQVISTLKSLQGLRIDVKFDADKLPLGWDRIFEPHFSKNKIAWYEVSEDKDPLLLEKLNNIRYSAAMDLMSSCVEPMCKKFRSKGDLSYTDYLLYLRDMLKKDAEGDGKLIEHIYNRHSYFLIDEFQDTDPVQAEIFFYLCAERPVSDWRKCKPKPGSLFIVGDPKQSIYRFRNADVASFQKVKALFKDHAGEVLTLSRNFRSTDILCGWFNKVFTDLLPADTQDQSRYESIPVGEKPEYKGSLNGTYKYSAKVPKKIADWDDPYIAAEIIRSIIDDPKMTIQGGGNDAVPRRPEYKDFMIITPGKNHMDYYMRALAERGIPFRIEGKLLFNECPALIMISKIMSAAADPFDKRKLFELNSISGCNVTEKTLFKYYDSKEMSPAAFFSMIMDREKVFVKAGGHNAEYVYYALELLRQAEIDGTVSSVKEGAAFVDSLITDGSELERSIQLIKDTNRVHIANLHKVKGLEAPIVILADPYQKSFTPVFRVDYSGETPQSWMFNLEDSAVCSEYKKEAELEMAALTAEKDRLLYVAATRAENALIVSMGKTSKGVNSPSNPWGVLDQYIENDIFAAVEHSDKKAVEGKTPVDANKLFEDAEQISPLRCTAPFEKSYEIIRPSTVKLKNMIDDEPEAEETSARSTAPLHAHSLLEDPALYGTMVHHMMEVLVSSKNKVDGDLLVESTLREYQADPDKYKSHLTSVLKTVRGGGYKQENRAPQDILAELLSADEVFCELPFCFSEDQKGIWHGVMDVVYRKNNSWHIIDYKTNADPSNLDEHYQEQLSSYIKAFKVMTGEDADAMIYHI